MSLANGMRRFQFFVREGVCREVVGGLNRNFAAVIMSSCYLVHRWIVLN